jgi:hypothetical protein
MTKPANAMPAAMATSVVRLLRSPPGLAA